MADLPADRLSMDPPFTNVGVDTFGPWEVKVRKTRGGQASSKRWVIIFTCLSIRAVHFEVVEDMSASAFINAFRRFTSIRGPVRCLRSDCGTNFTGAVTLIEDYLRKVGATWNFNTPHAPHHGGVWERMIGTAKRIFGAIRTTSKMELTHEVLVTFFAEVSAIINERPISPVSTDPENPFILTPATLLTQKTQASLALIEKTTPSDLHLAQWRKVQALAQMFWKRWKSEYLPLLLPRRKWQNAQENIAVGDVVVYRDPTLQRNMWPLAIVTEVKTSEDSLVRSVQLKVCREGQTRFFFRPLEDISVLIRSDT
jgi:hypothetical protein